MERRNWLPQNTLPLPSRVPVPPVMQTRRMIRFDGPFPELFAWHRTVLTTIGRSGQMDGDSYIVDVSEEESWQLSVPWKTGGFSETLKFQ